MKKVKKVKNTVPWTYVIQDLKDSEFYIRSMKSWSHDYDTEIYSMHNEGKFVVTKILEFIKTLENKIYIYMVSISKNAYIVKLNDIDNKYNNTCHKKIKIKSIDIKSGTHFNFVVGNKFKDPKSDVGDHVRI